jgi:hypothetical protein
MAACGVGVCPLFARAPPCLTDAGNGRPGGIGLRGRDELGRSGARIFIRSGRYVRSRQSSE